jgi:hypothetical protein
MRDDYDDRELRRAHRAGRKEALLGAALGAIIALLAIMLLVVVILHRDGGQTIIMPGTSCCCQTSCCGASNGYRGPQTGSRGLQTPQTHDHDPHTGAMIPRPDTPRVGSLEPREGSPDGCPPDAAPEWHPDRYAPAVSVPEPGTLALVALGVLAMWRMS